MTRFAALLAGLAIALPASAADVSVVGIFPGKAVLVIDDRSPRAYAAGADVTEGIRLLEVREDSAVLEINGKRKVIAMGAHINKVADSGLVSTTLSATAQGHFFADGQINGRPTRMLVDTGATLVAMPVSEAQRLGIDYRKGRAGSTSTANGSVTTWIIRLESVKVGDIVLNQVDAAVLESPMREVLLGMSFLKRMEMRRDGTQMVLTKRY